MPAARPSLPPPTEAAAYALLEQVRWSGAPPSCPHCGVPGRCHYLRPRTGIARRTRTGANSERRVWKCSSCRRQFSVLAGTVLQGTRISLRTWIAVAAAYADGGSVLTPGELAAAHGVSTEAARHLLKRLDVALAGARGRDPLRALLRIPAGDAARIRNATPPRVRPAPQRGPTADHGGA